MADKGTSWFNGAGAITRPQPASAQSPVSARTGSIIRIGLVAAAIAGFTMYVLGATPEPWAWEVLRLMAVGIIMLSVFYFPTDVLKPSFVIWWLLLISECVFFREGTMESSAHTYQGDFPTAAYGEAIMWFMSLLAIMVCWKRTRAYFLKIFEADYKWVTIFAIVSVGSFVYAPRATLSLVWGFKLTLVLLILVVSSMEMVDLKDTVAFLKFSFWAYVIIVLQPVILAIFRNDLFDEEGRMSTIVSPNALSPNAGVVVLLALTLYSTRKHEGMRKASIIFGFIGCAVMILAGSKTGILAGLFAGCLFYLICRKFGSAFGYIAATGILIAALALTTPLGDYFLHYHETSGADTFSGRTILWSAVMPAIKAKPIIGHGYMASEFLMFQVNAVGWAAPQLHNGFLEALYNGGIIALLPILIINIVIPINFVRVLRRTDPNSYVYRVGAGCLALYAFLLINGFFNSSYGGKPTAPFMLLLSLVLVSNKLLEQSSRPMVNGEPAVLDPRSAR
jgi:hypothetical protein